jgi:hypothetical protein
MPKGDIVEQIWGFCRMHDITEGVTRRPRGREVVSLKVLMFQGSISTGRLPTTLLR